jgi:hypothetical protein
MIARRHFSSLATPILGHVRFRIQNFFEEADDGVRTRDPQLGKLMLYQLSYVRARSLQVTHFRSWGESPKMSFHRVLRFN